MFALIKKKEKINNNLQQALCVVQSPTSEEEPLGSSGHQKCHQTDGSEETAGRCGTPPSNHRQSRRRRPLSTETSMSSSTTKQSGRSLAPPPPAAAPVKSHYKVISTTFFDFPLYLFPFQITCRIQLAPPVSVYIDWYYFWQPLPREPTQCRIVFSG